MRLRQIVTANKKVRIVGIMKTDRSIDRGISARNMLAREMIQTEEEYLIPFRTSTAESANREPLAIKVQTRH